MRMTLLVLLIVVATPVRGEDLAAVWASEAGPGSGYDRILHLDSLAVYTGGLYLTTGTNAIRGHGAILDLAGEAIRVLDFRTRLDIDGCVLMNGPPLRSTAALVYAAGSEGHVRNCVFYGNLWGLYMDEINRNATDIINCIFMNNSEWGAVLHDVYTPLMHHGAAFQNGLGLPPGEGGHYALWCGCSTPPLEYEPLPEHHCMIADPRFVDPRTTSETCDFHLAPGSPCLTAGDPPGTHIGAYQETPAPVEPTTWGAVKERFR